MAASRNLLPGFKYEIITGPLEGEVVTVVSNISFPDDDPHGRRRKITCLSPEGQEVYVLPRLLSDQPVGMDRDVFPVSLPAETTFEELVLAAAPVVTTAPVPSLPSPVYEEVTERQVQVVEVKKIVHRPITDPMDPRLDHLRPSKAKLKRYRSRTMANGMSDIEFFLNFTNDQFRAAFDGRPANVMLKGNTQSGKTLLVEVLAIKWAEMLGLPKPMPIFTISGSSGVTDFDLFGQTTSYTDPETGKERLVWLPGMVELAVQAGGILYLDEAQAFSERVTSSIHPLTDHRHFFVNRNKPVWKDGQMMAEVCHAHLDLWIISTMNEGYRGMGELNEAFSNRFQHMVWDYDKTVEEKLIDSPAIRLLGEALRTAREKNSIRTPIGTAALQTAELNVNTFGPVVGLSLLTSLFKVQERPVVESIIQDRSIILLLHEEQKQRDLNNKPSTLETPTWGIS